MRQGALALLLSIAAPASARDLCVIADPLPAAKPARVDWRNPAPADGYLLALSWSPEYCAGSRDRPSAALQCVDNRFLFVVHGLWPQNSRARGLDEQPRHCRTVDPLRPELIRRYVCLVPGVQLQQAQWAAHGACAFPDPEAYFAKTAELWNRLKRPQVTGAGTVGDIRRAFARANPGLPERSVFVALTDRGRLREVRICYDKAFRYAACARQGPPDRIAIRVRQP